MIPVWKRISEVDIHGRQFAIDQACRRDVAVGEAYSGLSAGMSFDDDNGCRIPVKRPVGFRKIRRYREGGNVKLSYGWVHSNKTSRSALGFDPPQWWQESFRGWARREAVIPRISAPAGLKPSEALAARKDQPPLLPPPAPACSTPARSCARNPPDHRWSFRCP